MPAALERWSGPRRDGAGPILYHQATMPTVAAEVLS
jgi:hypothetical protein